MISSVEDENVSSPRLALGDELAGAALEDAEYMSVSL